MYPAFAVDIGSPSHWHLDHLGYVGYGGFWWLITTGALTFGKIIDRDGAAWVGDGPCVLPDSGPLPPETLDQMEFRNIGTSGGTGELSDGMHGFFRNLSTHLSGFIMSRRTLDLLGDRPAQRGDLPAAGGRGAGL